MYLLSLPATELTKEYIALLPRSPPNPALPHGQLVEDLLREEFGGPISERLTSLPSSEIKKEKNKSTCRENHAVAVTEAREMREEGVRSWPRIVPNEIAYGCLNAYYEGS